MCKLSQTFYFCAVVLLSLVLLTKFLCFALGVNASHKAFALQNLLNLRVPRSASQ